MYATNWSEACLDLQGMNEWKRAIYLFKELPEGQHEQHTYYGASSYRKTEDKWFHGILKLQLLCQLTQVV